MKPVTTLLLDGIWARPRRWRKLLRLIEETSGPAEIFEYDSSGFVQFEVLGARLADAIHRHGVPVNVIGFSMGGMVVRAAKLVDASIRLSRAVFLNSPHEGSLLAYALPIPGVRQLRPTDPFMKRLRGGEWDIPTLAVWCPADQMVVPGWSARWGRATEYVCSPVPAHVWPIWSKSIHRRVAAFLAAGSN